MRIMGPSSPRCGASAAARSLARPSPAVGRPGEACALHTLPPRGLCSARRGPTSEPDFVWRSCCGAKSMLRRLLLWCAIAWAVAGAAAAAADYPTKPVQLIVPFAAGGASSPVLAALFALAERAPVSGTQFLLAYAAGFEAGVRSGRTAPGHHKGGWHLTGTLGSIAAGVAAGKLLGLDAQRLAHAMGIAATQAAGMQQNRGTMCKSFHAGKAAANGTLAALLAERGFDSTQEIIEGERGFARIYSDVSLPEQLTAALDEGWLIE